MSRAARYLVFVVLLTWTLELPAVLAHLGVLEGPADRFLPLVALGALLPTFVAIYFSRQERPTRGSVFARFLLPGGLSPLSLLALFLPGAAVVLGVFVVRLVSSATTAFFYLPVEPERVVALVLFSVGEEIGWRGYALPRLLEERSRLSATLVVAVFWSLWHLPMFVIADVPLAAYPVAVVYFASGSVISTWLFERTGGSLLTQVLFHMGAHLNNPNRTLPDDMTPLVAATAVFAALASWLVLREREAWLAGPASREAGESPQEAART